MSFRYENFVFISRFVCFCRQEIVILQLELAWHPANAGFIETMTINYLILIILYKQIKYRK